MKKHFNIKKSFRIAAASVMAGTAAFLLFLSAAAAVSLAVDLSDSVRKFMSVFASLCGYAVSGTVSAFFYRKKGIKAGISGSMHLMIFLIAVYGIFGMDISFYGLIRNAFTALAAGTAGGTAGVNIKMNDKKYKIINSYLYSA